MTASRDNARWYDNMRRAPRYHFPVEAKLTDLESEIQLRGQIRELSLFGCGIIDTARTFPPGAKVKIELVHEDAKMVALGRVVYAQRDLGMGIAFTTVETEDRRVLKGWIAELASRQALQR